MPVRNPHVQVIAERGHVGRMLLERLIAAAGEREVRRIRCHLLADNERMRRLIARVHGDAALTHEGEMMRGEFSVPAANDPKYVAQDECIAPLFNPLSLVAVGSVMSVKLGLVSARYDVTWMTPYISTSKAGIQGST